MCQQIQALFSVLAQFVVEQLLLVIEPYNVMSANKWCHIGPKCEIVAARIYSELIHKKYFNWNCPVSKDYHLRYDAERTVDQHSNTPSPDAGARPQSQCTSQSWNQDENPADNQDHSTHKDLKIVHLSVARLLSKISEIRLLLSVVKFNTHVRRIGKRKFG